MSTHLKHIIGADVQPTLELLWLRVEPEGKSVIPRFSYQARAKGAGLWDLPGFEGNGGLLLDHLAHFLPAFLHDFKVPQDLSCVPPMPSGGDGRV